MRKLLSLLLCFTMLFVLSACSKEAEKKAKDKALLPAGIKFEMSYDKIKEELPDTLIHNGDRFSELDENNSISAIISEDQWHDFLGSDVNLGNKAATYYFDNGKDLYSLYAIFSFDNESDLEDLLNAFIDRYSELTDTDPKETTDVLSSEFFDWETDDIKVQLYLPNLGGSIRYMTLSITHPEYSHPK